MHFHVLHPALFDFTSVPPSRVSSVHITFFLSLSRVSPALFPSPTHVTCLMDSFVSVYNNLFDITLLGWLRTTPWSFVVQLCSRWPESSSSLLSVSIYLHASFTRWLVRDFFAKFRFSDYSFIFKLFQTIPTFQVKKASALSEDDVVTFYTSRAVDENVCLFLHNSNSGLLAF